ncbi:MAG: TIGR00725 family protein [Candidatus Binataceae bacterium]|nr:TIGR00725 family protein [Candidatus Binataceae bacterium]
MNRRRLAIAVIGAGQASSEQRILAREVGSEIGRRNGALICGGRGGVMEAAAQGALAAGGHTIGILPGYNHADANPHIEFVIATGMGQARNMIVVASADAIIALPGEAGTLSEIGLAMKIGRPVIALKAWEQLSGLHRADTPGEAVALAFALGRGDPR